MLHERTHGGRLVTSLPRAPRVRRRVRAAKQLVAGVAVLLALPITAAAGLLGPGAFDRSLKVLVVFLVLLGVFRLIGKRELGRLSPFELVTLMLIPEVLSDVVQSEGSLLHGFVGLSTLLLLVLITSVLAHRFEGVEKVVEARATLLVADGKVLDDALNEERILPDELVSEMRKQGIGDVSEVRWAVLESSGNITFVKKRGTEARHSDDAPPT